MFLISINIPIKELIKFFLEILTMGNLFLKWLPKYLEKFSNLMGIKYFESTFQNGMFNFKNVFF